MRVAGLWALAALLAAPSASAQLSQRCEGETWSELARARYDRAELAALLQRFNRGEDPERCTRGRFVRFPATVPHTLALGQNLAAVLPRFCQAPGALALVLERSGLPAGVEPAPGARVQIPTELILSLGQRPEAELAEIPGLPSLAVIRAYNGLGPGEPLSAGSTIYVPLYLDARSGSPTPPKTERIATTDPAPSGVRTGTAPPARGSFEPVPVSGRVRAVDFRHDQHRATFGRGYECGLCHLGDHERPYPPVPEAVCTTCHASVEPRSGPRWQRLPLQFSHALHLDPSGRVRADGFELDCARCHPADAAEEPTRANHGTCIRCHNQLEVPPAVEKDCAGCHRAAEQGERLRLASALLFEHQQLTTRGKSFRFEHGGHLRALNADGVSGEATCERCHAGARHADVLDAIEPLRMADCLDCHRGLVREARASSTRLDRCLTCHLSDRVGTPPALATSLDRPLSHTASFRVDHAREAETDQGICQSCHPELAGGPARDCAACHLKVRPRDHGARWREEPHGRAAVRRGPDRCATCHARDRCADCHAQPPRDHFPRSVFLVRHGNAAAISIRRCQTCHVAQVDCARCHALGSQ